MSMGSTKVRLAAMLAGFALVASVAFIAAAELPKTKHINRAIELLEQGQPIYYTGSHSGTTGTFEQGKQDAQTYRRRDLGHGSKKEPDKTLMIEDHN